MNIVNQYRRVNLAYSIDAAQDNIINARVEGDAVSVGTYALEIRGKIFGNDWRSKEYEQFAIVDNNASGDTAFNGELIEGEDSVCGWTSSFEIVCTRATSVCSVSVARTLRYGWASNVIT